MTRHALAATLIRFNSEGYIDAINSWSYSATNQVAYSAGQTFHVRMVVDVLQKRYSVYLRRSGTTTEILLANNFKFRSTTRSVTNLNTLAYVRTLGTASLTGFTVTNIGQPANSPPLAIGDQATVHHDTSVLVNVLSNDSDPDNNPLTITGVTTPSNGVIAIESNQLRYTPNSGFSGTDQVTYTISDGVAQAQAQVTFTVEDDSDHGEIQKYVLTQGTDTLGSIHIYPVVSNDQHGFRFPCVASHFSYDDPVVFPNQPERAHLHMYWGNTGVNAFSTSNSIATTGNSSCIGGIVNRSAYWMPALLNANMETVIPSSIWVYYKSFVDNRLLLRPIPAGLQMLAHRDVLNAEARNFGAVDHDGVTVNVDFPDCVQVDSNGNPVLSSVGGKSHLAYSSGMCPPSHPYMIPMMSIHVNFPSVPYNTAWQLSSDISPATKGESLHADYVAGWTSTNAQVMRNCVAESRECYLDDAAVGAEEMFYSPSGVRVFQDQFTIYPGFDITPFGSSLPKNLTEHSH